MDSRNNEGKNKIGIFLSSVLNDAGHLFMVPILIMHTLSSCSDKGLSHDNANYKAIHSISRDYNHFEGGVLFTNVEEGLDVLWVASFKNGNNLYKENAAFFVPDGLLILPNTLNTPRSATLSVIEHYIDHHKLFVRFAGTSMQVLGIVHTHPDIFSLHIPAPKNDYQYSRLGIHNYVMDHRCLLDAYKDPAGREVFTVLGKRDTYKRIPFNIMKEETIITLAIGNSVYKSTYYSQDSTSFRNRISAK
jgi:hypothetical protein